MMSVIAQHRRDMLGNPDECMPPNFDQPYAALKLGKFTLGGGSAGAMDAIDKLRKRPWLRELDNDFDPPAVPYVRHVYINGLRFDGNPLWVLRNLPPDQVASVRYADCWDTSMPLDRRYAIYVVLKPASRRVQDSIINLVQTGGRARLYGTDMDVLPKCKASDTTVSRSCRTKLKPTRAVYDSLLQSLRRHDSS